MSTLVSASLMNSDELLAPSLSRCGGPSYPAFDRVPLPDGPQPNIPPPLVSPAMLEGGPFTCPSAEPPEMCRGSFSMGVLVELYLRLRGEHDREHREVNPNDPSWARIAMAVLEAGEDSKAHSTNIESISRRLLGSRLGLRVQPVETRPTFAGSSKVLEARACFGFGAGKE